MLANSNFIKINSFLFVLFLFTGDLKTLQVIPVSQNELKNTHCVNVIKLSPD